ncbi:MAG: DEAD/DEAH box helicase family protein [Chloroflexi bacterium]|nr:DEAD/DEAH box helicase family protein [Chloroflexota bacterium]
MENDSNNGFQSLLIEDEYRGFRTNVVKDFYIPVLSKTKIYKRAVGFFSSSSLLEISQGITGLVKNNGRIQLISSPHLSEDDYKAIQKGYFERDHLNKILINRLSEPINYFEQQRLNLLANLIKEGTLDVKIAFLKNKSGLGLYHEKMGLVEDFSGNQVAFSGSLNESLTAFRLNYESIDVFCSWKNQDQLKRVNSKASAFISIWDNDEINIDTIEIPEVKDEIINRYLNSKPNLDIDFDEYFSSADTWSTKGKSSDQEVTIPENISLYEYQIEAINNWRDNNFRGIFDMATGTGKTFTALGGIVNLYEHTNGELAVIIACPFQHLVEQWVEDIVIFGINPIIGYSKSSQKDWKTKLSNAIRDQKLKVPGKEFFCFVTTNATFRSDFVKSQIKKIKGNALLVADEAHNFGAKSLQTLLPENFKYRLALSATIVRHGDEIGTQAIFNYFGEKCIKYTLERAIAEKKLTEYYYYPVLVTLTNDELEVYKELTRRISKCIYIDKFGKETLTELGKQLAIKRSRIVAGAFNKLATLKEQIHPHLDESHILVYCGAASIIDPDIDETPISADDLRQIDQVTYMLGDELQMQVSQFTSREDVKERKILKKEFESGDMLQALIAIKCLDEGVNIPKIKTAFILASTTNPKEYIQRRGRVLRLADGKEYSIIYDFLTIPYDLTQAGSQTEEEISQYKTLIRNEIARGYEFANIAINSFEAKRVLEELEEAFNIFEDFTETKGE